MNWDAVVISLEGSALFNDAHTAWVADGHTGQSKATFAEALTFPLTNAGKGIAPPFASMSPAEVARHVIVMLCASKYCIDRDI